jgi:hypothetical protein
LGEIATGLAFAVMRRGLFNGYSNPRPDSYIPYKNLDKIDEEWPTAPGGQFRAEISMSSYAPVTLRVIDDKGQELFSQSVPFEWELDVKQIMERAFVLAQTTVMPDPFLYSVEYYGYSEAAQYPGYLGYEIESICGKYNNQQFYWALLINGVLSPEGADSMQPGPGSSVVWQYTPIPTNPRQLAARTRVVHSRRAARRAFDNA